MIWQDRCMRGEHSFSVGASLWKSRARCWTATRTAQPKRREPWSNSRPWRCLNHTGDLSWTTWWWPWWPRLVKKQRADVKWLLDMSPNVTKWHKHKGQCHRQSNCRCHRDLCKPWPFETSLVSTPLWKLVTAIKESESSESIRIQLQFQEFNRTSTCTCNGSPFPMYSHQWWPSQKCRERCRLLGDGTVPVPG